MIGTAMAFSTVVDLPFDVPGPKLGILFFMIGAPNSRCQRHSDIFACVLYSPGAGFSSRLRMH